MGSIGFNTEKTILFQGSKGGPTLSRGGGPNAMVLIQRKLYFSKDLGPTLSRGGPNANSYRNPYNLCFSRGGGGGSGPPIPPLDPHMHVQMLMKAQVINKTSTPTR